MASSLGNNLQTLATYAVVSPSQLMVGPTSLVSLLMRDVKMVVHGVKAGQYAGRKGPRTEELTNTK